MKDNIYTIILKNKVKVKLGKAKVISGQQESLIKRKAKQKYWT